jgi:hypothetical protein
MPDHDSVSQYFQVGEKVLWNPANLGHQPAG